MHQPAATPVPAMASPTGHPRVVGPNMRTHHAENEEMMKRRDTANEEKMKRGNVETRVPLPKPKTPGSLVQQRTADQPSHLAQQLRAVPRTVPPPVPPAPLGAKAQVVPPAPPKPPAKRRPPDLPEPEAKRQPPQKNPSGGAKWEASDESTDAQRKEVDRNKQIFEKNEENKKEVMRKEDERRAQEESEKEAASLESSRKDERRAYLTKEEDKTEASIRGLDRLLARGIIKRDDYERRKDAEIRLFTDQMDDADEHILGTTNARTS